MNVAFGMRVRFLPTSEGGRRTAVADGRATYRPNWGLPGATPPDQTGAPVLGLSRERVEPGEEAYAVVVPLDPPAWQALAEGDVLPCYEGVRVVAYGTVLSRWECADPLGDEDVARCEAWLNARRSPPAT